MRLTLEEFNTNIQDFELRLELNNPQVSMDIEFMPKETRLVWKIYSYGKLLIKLIHSNSFDRGSTTLVYGNLLHPEPLYEASYARMIIEKEETA